MWLLDRVRPQRSAAPTRDLSLIVNGHPDPRPERFCAALAHAYGNGIQAAGGRPETIAVGMLTDRYARHKAVDLMHGAARVTLVFPLWLGKPPPLLSQFLDETGSADCMDAIVTMEMPAFLYRSQPTIAHVPAAKRAMLIGSIDTISSDVRAGWLNKARRLGQSAESQCRKLTLNTPKL